MNYVLALGLLWSSCFYCMNSTENRQLLVDDTNINQDVLNDVRKNMRSLYHYGFYYNCIYSAEAYLIFDEMAMENIEEWKGISDISFTLLKCRRLINENGVFNQEKLAAWKFLKPLDESYKE